MKEKNQNLPKLPRMSITVLLLMIQMIQFSLAIPFVNHSCHTTSEYPQLGCISFTKHVPEYLQEYLPPSQALAHDRVEQRVNKLDIYLKHYPSQYVNCLSRDSEFIIFISHAFDLSVDLMVFPTIWTVLTIILETQDTNSACVEVLHAYYNRYYSSK